MKNYISLLCLSLGFISTMQATNFPTSTSIDIPAKQTLTALWISPVFQHGFHAELPIHTKFQKNFRAIQKALVTGPVIIDVNVQPNASKQYQVVFTAHDAAQTTKKKLNEIAKVVLVKVTGPEPVIASPEVLRGARQSQKKIASAALAMTHKLVCRLLTPEVGQGSSFQSQRRDE